MILEYFSVADMSVLNFEGNLSGAPYGKETGSAPVELAQALKNAGYRVVDDEELTQS